jgi:hypothetical protein
VVFSIDMLERYLDKPMPNLLAELPFAGWPYEREVDAEIGRIDYTFLGKGFDIVCDLDERIRTIFIVNDGSHLFREGLTDLSFSSTRREVCVRLGLPAKSGGPQVDAILGALGRWDRFARSSGCSVHVEFQVDRDCIKRVTLMREGV